MNKGQLDGAVLDVVLSDAILRDRSRSKVRSRSPRPPLRARNGRGSHRRSLSRSLSPYRRRAPFRDRYRSRYSPPPRRPSSYFERRRAPPGRDTYRPRSISRSRSPIRRGPSGRLGGRRSPSYERGGTGYRGRRSRSRSSYSLTSSRSRSRSRSYSSRSRSRLRSRSRSYSYSSKSSKKSRSRSVRSSRSRDRDDIRDSRSRSRSP